MSIMMSMSCRTGGESSTRGGNEVRKDSPVIEVSVEPSGEETCALSETLRRQRSQMLQEIVAQDQADRRDGSLRTLDGGRRTENADLQRRKQVADIFAEGCFSSAEDYAAGALVFQHGDVPDHYWLAFTWARRAVDLGDTSRRSLVAVTLDRFLVKSGHKQLFGSQALRSTTDGACWCLGEVEPSFPDAEREGYGQPKLQSRYDWVDRLNAQSPRCKGGQCDDALAPSPRGTVPGFW
jgi:hypothetical protein